jgi:hypothetical protein
MSVVQSQFLEPVQLMLADPAEKAEKMEPGKDVGAEKESERLVEKVADKETAANFDDIKRQLIEEWRPNGYSETICVQQLALLVLKQEQILLGAGQESERSDEMRVSQSIRKTIELLVSLKTAKRSMIELDGNRAPADRDDQCRPPRGKYREAFNK